uniref:DUF5641 domain-containing protein n=1 Tax=Cacopsylla melanoneura TaxID=428564 RepID=A0A8D9BNJ5_9HEMI
MSAEEKAIRGLTLATQKRQNHWQSIQICHDLIKELNNPTKLATFKVRCDKVEEDYRKFEDIQDKILELNGFVSDTEQITDVLSKKKALDDLYFAIKAAQQAQVATTSSNPTTPMPSPTPVKLPQINIPVFDGTYEAFSSFKSLFDTLVHSQTGLTTIEKFSYLKSLLSGAALACIQGFSFSEDNYPLAYQTLVTQFSNKRVVANSICNKLWSFKPLSHDSQLRSFLETFNVSVEAFKAVGIPQTGDFLILYMALRVLDPSTRQAFENSWIGKTPVPQYKDLLDFVRGRVSVSDLITPAPPKPPVARTFSQPAKSSQTSVVKRSFVANVAPPSSTPAKSVRGCPCCSKPHRLSDCKKFLNLTVPEKYSLLKEKHMCFSCFGPHSRQICNSRFTCRQCGAKTHHTLLHPSQPRDGAFATVSGTSQDCSVPSTSRPASPSTNALNSTLSCGLVDSSLSRQVLLGTAIVSVQDCFGHVHDVRALIDAGSMINIITQPLAARLCLPTKPTDICISGIGSSQPTPAKGLVSCTVHSKRHPFSVSIDAAVLPTISANIPALPVSQEVIDRLAGVLLADPLFFSPAPVQMLIGAQNYADLMRTSEPIIVGEPSLVPSNLGVLVMGVTSSTPAPSAPLHSFFISHIATGDKSANLANRGCSNPTHLVQNEHHIVQNEHHIVQNERKWSGSALWREPPATLPSHTPALVIEPPDLKDPVSAKPPEPIMTANRLTRWELLNQVTQHFWKRWAREYLHTLIERHKWVAKYENIKVGDIVVIMIDNQPPMSWPLARITLVHPAQDDGVVRIVTLKTSSGILIRPVRKLLLLPHC